MKYDSWNSYPKVYEIHHREVRRLIEGDIEVLLEEKLDGSQSSFGVIDGTLRIKSKNQEPPDPKLFDKAMERAEELQDDLHPGWTYRAEYLKTPDHNTLEYDHVPDGNLILFDIARGYEDYLSREEKKEEAERIGIPIVPVLYQGIIDGTEQLEEFLGQESCLGGSQIEGVTIKSYDHFGSDKKPLMGKYVDEDFIEKHSETWAREHNKKSCIDSIVDALRTEARWKKSIQHRRERGEQMDAVQDIQPLIKEIRKDVKEEEEEWIKQELFDNFWSEIEKRITGGFPRWYKEWLEEEGN